MLHEAKACGCTREIGSSRAHIPQTCKHGNVLLYAKQLGRSVGTRTRSTLKRSRRRETAAEKRARLHFNEVVKGWPCWFRATRPCERCEGAGEIAAPLQSGGVEYGPRFITCPTCGGDGKHHCRGPKDAHHVIPKDFIRQRFRGLISEEELLAILFNPLIGAPLCRYGAHEPVEKGTDRIYWQDLSEECLEYVGSLPDFMLLRLELECPKRLDQTAKEAVTTGCQEGSNA